MVRVNNIDRYELVAEALRMIDADKYADKINELEAFRQEAFQFAVDNGYDHPDYTDWVYSGVNTTKQGAVSLPPQPLAITSESSLYRLIAWKKTPEDSSSGVFCLLFTVCSQHRFMKCVSVTVHALQWHMVRNSAVTHLKNNE